MAWSWRADPLMVESQPGLQRLGFGDPFDNQLAAEAWLTANYPALTDLGVQAVSLYEEDRLVYGPMNLAVD